MIWRKNFRENTEPIGVHDLLENGIIRNNRDLLHSVHSVHALGRTGFTSQTVAINEKLEDSCRPPMKLTQLMKVSASHIPEFC